MRKRRPRFGTGKGPEKWPAMRSLKLSGVFQGLGAQLHPFQRQLALGNEGVVQRVFAQDAPRHVLGQPAGLIGFIVAAPFTIEIVVVQLLQPGMGRPSFALGRLQGWEDLGPFLIERFQPADACQIFRGQQGRVAGLGIHLHRRRGWLTNGCIGRPNRRDIGSQVDGSRGVRCIDGRLGRSLGRSFFKDIGMDEAREACIRKTAFHKTSTRFTI